MKSFSTSSINPFLKKYDSEKDSLISLLQGIQEKLGYLPKEALKHVSTKLDVPLSELFSIVTFYNSFNLEPQGENIVSVCLGTACHVKNGENLSNMIGRELKLGDGEETTHDRKFTLKKVRCLGCCSIAPVVKVNDTIHGYMTQTKTATLLKKYRKDKKA
ncbi:MAG: NAD(P)H-dependent oxidoreductase subunit E [Deltaproteobacteria bacterium]|nr:NAD(P)H-dependent oxidoreductase subunit E [Deltaproteobacteria bacterium]